MKKELSRRWWSALLFAAAVIVLWNAIGNIGTVWQWASRFLGILSPFIGGFVIAFLLYRPCTAMENAFSRSRFRLVKKPARVWAMLLSYLGLLVALGLLVSVVVPLVLEAVRGLITSLPTYYTSVMGFLQRFSTEEDGVFSVVNLQDLLQELYNFLRQYLTAENLISYLSGIMSVTSTFADMLIAFIASVYMLAGRESLFRAVRRVSESFLSERAVRLSGHYCHKASVIFTRYVYSMLLDALVIGVLLIPGLLISGIPYPLSFTVIIGACNLVPYFGALISGCGAVLVLLLSGNWGMALFLAIYIVVVQQLDGNVLQPRIFGQSVGIEPVYVLLAITVGGGLGGLVGMLVGVPVTAVLKILVSDLLTHRDHVKRMKAAEQESADG